MSNPFKPDFCEPSRMVWCRETRKWLRRYANLTTKELGAMLDMSPAVLSVYGYPRPDRTGGPVWLCEILGAMVAGWRPSVDWSRATFAQREEIFLDGLKASGLPDQEAEWFFLARNARHWRALVDGRASSMSARLAVIGEAFVAGVIPCGLPFGEWAE